MPSPSARFGAWTTALTLCGLALVVLCALAAFDRDRARALVAEHGPIEWIQVALMSGAAALTARHGIAAAAAGRPATLEVGIVAALGVVVLAEMDVDRVIFGMKIFATEFFVNPDYPLALRAVTALVSVGVPAAIGLWLLRRWRAVLTSSVTGLREPWGQVAAFGLALYVLVQFFERAIDALPWQPRSFFEETLEFLSALCMVVGLAARRW